MKEKKEILPLAFQENMTYQEDSWLVVQLESFGKPKVVFYTPSQDGEDAMTFKDFAEIYFEENFEFSVRDGADMIFEENKIQALGGEAIESEDYEEESRKVIKEIVATGKVIHVYQNKKLEDLPEIIKEVQKDLHIVELNAKERGVNQVSSKDLYAHHGVKRKDFF